MSNKPGLTPVTVLGGYLGSGKTTLVNHLLRHADGKRLAILVNDFGDIAIDADLIEAEEDDIISLSGGCVCCSYGSDLLMAMGDMAKLDTPPDHIILEASGVAMPGAIAGSISLLPDYHVEGIVVVSDAETVRERADDPYTGDTITRQLEVADLVLLNKVDLISDAQREDIKDWLADRAKNARIVETQFCNINADILLLGLDGASRFFHSPDHGHDGQHRTEFIEFQQPIDVRDYAENLVNSQKRLVRAKGFVPDQDGSLKTLQITGKRIDIQMAPDAVSTGMVLIYVNDHV